jgi:MFS family permease
MESMLVQPLVSKRAARLSIGAFFFIAGLCFASWASRIPDIKLHLQLSDGVWGAVLFALPVGLMVSLPFSGWLVHHFGSRKMILIAGSLYPLVLCNIGLVQHTWQLVLVLFAFGLIGNLSNIAVNTQAVSLEVLYGRSIMASFHGLWSLAGFSGATIGNLMINLHFAPFTHFCMVAGMAFLLIGLLYRNTLQQDVNADDDRPLFAKPDATLLKLGLIAMCCMVCEGAMFEWSGVYFQKVVQAPKGLVILGFTAFMATMAGGRFVGDKLVTRLGTLRVLQLSGVVIATGLAIAITFPTVVTAALGFMLVGIGVSSVIPLVYSVAGKSTVFSPGVALAAVSTIGYLGFLAGPPMIGFISQAINLRVSFALIAFLGFMTTIISSKTKF